MNSKIDASVAKLAHVWDTRARLDARHHIKCDLDDASHETFDSSGAEDIRSFVDPWLDKLEQAGRALDIGCGIGRLTRPLAQRFDEVVGVDISPEMVRKAQEEGFGPKDNVSFQVVDGSGSLPFPDNSFDFVFSYIVFQHLPSLALVERYFAESCRVLKPGALARVQLNTRRRPLRQRLKIRWVGSDRVPLLHKKLKIKLDPHDFMGVVLSETECRALAARAGFEVVQLGPLGVQYTWMTLRSLG